MVALAQRALDVGLAVGPGVEAALEVGARAEAAAGAGEHDRAHRLVGGDGLDRLAQIAAQVLAPGVHHLWAVQLDRRDAVGDGQVDVLELEGGGVGACGHASYASGSRTQRHGMYTFDGMSGNHRPRIGLCTALERAKWSYWDLEALLLPRSYVDAVQRAGGLALMIPPDPELAGDPDERARPPRRAAARGRRRRRPRRLRRRGPRGDQGDRARARRLRDRARPPGDRARHPASWASAAACR